MSQQRSTGGLRRDPGPVATVGDLLGAAFAGLVVGIAVVLVLEGILALTGIADFGRTNGWLIVILPVWLFVEQFRAAGYGADRVIVALLGIGFGTALGMTVAGLLAPYTPPLVSGGAGAVTGTVVYCFVWFYGLRWLRRRSG
ncbi:hypothetical protein [Actinoplanes teichomyceticus]|uniref:Uncharacterized protein n=1 Tax=Actinoplanes teichomyceticus TaxID=1867 RepID=A0A561WS14_ACTTI|nr:hypothetical protein [Actinoplanes teichomyceticus]TWG26655.1 hypothetical protein FHX34_1011651 [Actinoplanes teichomyceticus]GIF15056.1 hypothetical protein Ate01nite_50880 [Actinoplanes teichomyceticus]